MTKNNKRLSFPVMFQKIDEVNSYDCRFTRVKVWLMHLGMNHNACTFEKGAVDAAMPTLQYIPIVGFLDKNKLGEEDFSDHRYIITKDDKGVRRKYIGSAYGVILSNEDNNAHYEDRLCDDGITRTFLVVDGVIWNQFENSADILNRDIVKSHSMELVDTDDSIEGYEDEDGVFHFTKFTFRAACILGNDEEPAMINSTVEVQSSTVSDFTRAIQDELSQKLTAFTKLVNENNQGGIDMPKTENPVVDNEAAGTTKATTDFAQTVMEQFDDISNIVSQFETYEDRWGDKCSRYYLRDIQESEVIVVDRKDSYHVYGFPFVINGDKPEIDFTNGKRKKTQYVDYEESETTTIAGAFDFGKHIEEVESAVVTKVEEAISEKDAVVSEFEKLKTEYDEIKPKYDEFCKKELEAQEAAIVAEKEALFTKFDAHLSDIPEYEELKDKSDEMTVEELTGQCSIMFTKKKLSVDSDFSKAKGDTLSADIPDIQDEEEGYIATKYGNIPIRR